MPWEGIQSREKKSSAVSEEAKGKNPKTSNQIHFNMSEISSWNIKMHIQDS